MTADRLTDADRRLLRTLSGGTYSLSELEVDAELDADADDGDALEARLEFFLDNGLIREVDDDYALTDSGRRVLTAPGDGSADDRIDVSPAVERKLADLDVRGDCAGSVRAVYAFLRYWGDATPSEIRDAVFSERPAIYTDRREWWRDCIDPVLDRLPKLRAPADRDTIDALWRYDDRPDIETESPDGRRMLTETDDPRFGSARRAIEDHPHSASHRSAFRRAFAVIESRGSVDDDTLDSIITATDAEGSTVQYDPEAVREVLTSIPTVVRVETDAGVRWEYRQLSVDAA